MTKIVIIIVINVLVINRIPLSSKFLEMRKGMIEENKETMKILHKTSRINVMRGRLIIYFNINSLAIRHDIEMNNIV